MDKIATVLRSLALSPNEISVRIGVPIERVEALLQGAKATLAELRALSRGLRIPIRTFASAGPAVDLPGDLGMLFRAAVRDRGPGFEATFQNVADIVDGALQVLPKRNQPPDWLQAFVVSGETYQEAHRLAHLFRTIFVAERLDEPLTDLPELLVEKAGVVLAKLHYSRYEGASILTGGYAFIFVSPRFAARMLFTLAHELGHLIAHRDSQNTAIFERPSQIGRASRSRSRAEAFVDAFASILLLPDRGVGRALKKIREILGVKSAEIGDVEILLLGRMFGVSFEVAARRCEDLGLLPDGGAISLVAQLKKDFGNPERRAAELNLPPRPTVRIPSLSANLVSAIVDKVSAGAVSVGWACDRFGLSVAEIYTANARRDEDSELRH